MSKRDVILDIAERSVLSKGFASTSIDEIITEAEISKNGFFYHFPDKNALAKAMLQRYVDYEDEYFDKVFSQSADLYSDPLDQFLGTLSLIAKDMKNLPTAHPGCLVATLAYSERLFDRDVRKLNEAAALGWRNRFLQALKTVTAVYPLPASMSERAMADMVVTTIEGGIIQSRALREPGLLADQIEMLRLLIERSFRSTAE